MMVVLVIVLGLINLVLWSDIFYRQFFKRFYDVILSFLAIIVLSPVFLILTILGAIKMKGNPLCGILLAIRPTAFYWMKNWQCIDEEEKEALVHMA